MRLFHKELEAYMVAEGLFDDEVTEDGTNLITNGCALRTRCVLSKVKKEMKFPWCVLQLI